MPAALMPDKIAQPLAEVRQAVARSQASLQKPPVKLPIPPTQLTWIRIKLVDDLGKPVPGMDYEIKFSDGTIQSGKLDDNGIAEHRQIKPGECEVRFPELDANDWEPV